MNRLEKLQQWFHKRINEGRLKSPWIVHFDCGSCNGCDIETLACLTPVYDVERFGIINVGNPKHADVLLVTGTVNSRNRHVLKNIYDQMPEPKAVIAIGACGMTGGIFRECYNVLGGVDQVIPVDVYVPGCPAKPEAIIDGVVVALEKIKVKLGLIEDPALPQETGSAEVGAETAPQKIEERTEGTSNSESVQSCSNGTLPADDEREALAGVKGAEAEKVVAPSQDAVHFEQSPSDAGAVSPEVASETAFAAEADSATPKSENDVAPTTEGEQTKGGETA